MDHHLKLTEAEKVFVRRIESQARLWVRFRWIGLFGGLTLAVGGAWDVCAVLGRDLSSSPAALAGTFGAWSLLLMGFVLITHIIARWNSGHRDQLLVRLLRLNDPELQEAEKSGEHPAYKGVNP